MTLHRKDDLGKITEKKFNSYHTRRPERIKLLINNIDNNSNNNDNLKIIALLTKIFTFPYNSLTTADEITPAKNVFQKSKEDNPHD